MNLDKCIGCHTCSVTCKQVWTNRPGTEYVWFNNVETKPGLGYPRRWADQAQWKGGWELDGKGRLRLRAGGRIKKLLTIFSNPDLPLIDDFYEPWTYDYETLVDAPLSDTDPVARPHSQLTGKPMEPSWGPNWDEGLAGGPATAMEDPLLADMQEQVRMTYEQAFMFFLPRICEHCLNPSCVASCPSGAMYKREEDGIVLVDQDRCRGWRYCVSGCPYKKVYFNHSTGKAEKCTFCYPRIEAGQPTICSETCVGRIRYLGCSSTTPTASRRPRRSPTSASCWPPALGLPRSRGPGGARGRARRRHPRRLDRARPPLARLRPGGPLAGRPAAAPRVPHAADGLVRPAAVAGRRDARDRRLRGRPRRRLRRHRQPPHPAAVPGEPAQRRRHRGDPRRPAPAGGDALLHAQARGPRRGRRGGARARRPDRPRARADVPAAGDRQLRGPLRHPAGARRAGRRAHARAGQLRPGLRRRPGNCGAVEAKPDTSSPIVPHARDRGFDLIDILRGGRG